MEGIHRILVVSRLTRYCRKAVRFGVSLAQTCGAELAVLHVVENPFKRGWNLPTIHYEDQYKKEMARVKAELEDIINSEKKKGMTIREFIEEGDPKEEILRVIGRERIDLAILTAHEEGRLEHFLYGRGIDAIVRRMPCSILLVRQ